ncbi:unnamed protein product [Amoebophrya sp. A25]|nr:unnamed protein product [Amoebophrya sp. A25]|eukprot:GSA25T00002816001.1
MPVSPKPARSSSRRTSSTASAAKNTSNTNTTSSMRTSTRTTSTATKITTNTKIMTWNSTSSSMFLLGSDRVVIALLVSILGYFHYVRFIEDDLLQNGSSGSPDDADIAFSWRMFSWSEFKSLPETVRDPELTYMSIFGYVFNVTSAPHFYKPGEGGYALFHGRECTRSIALASLEQEDVDRGVDDLEERDLEEARESFVETYLAKYPILGRIQGYPSVLQAEGIEAAAIAEEAGSDDEVPAPECENLAKHLVGPCRRKIARRTGRPDESTSTTSERKNSKISSSSAASITESNSSSTSPPEQQASEQLQPSRGHIPRPRPFEYDPSDPIREQGETKKPKAKPKGQCPVRIAVQTVVKVYKVIKNSVPRLMR